MFPSVRFVIEECTRQNDLTFESVANMTSAWEFAFRSYICGDYENTPYTITTKFILELGRIIKFDCNHMGFRKTPVIFANGSYGVSWQEVPRLVNQLIDNMASLSPDEFYIEFEKIHPFEDGNGRVGAILWNLLMKNYAAPVCPPNFFNN